MAGLGLMEMQQWITLILGAVGLLLQAGALAVGFTWKLATVKEALSSDIIDNRDELRTALDAERRVVGETLSALRQKINDVELYAANTYVRRDSWHQAMNALQESIGKSDELAEQRMQRIEDKIDRLAERISATKQ